MTIMFIKSFKKFEKNVLNFKFNLIDTKLSENEYIIENKQQATSILKKLDIPESNADFKYIQRKLEHIFNSLNYLGLFTKFKFQQNVSTQELVDLMPWLKDSAGKLPKNALAYEHFENLKDDIITIDNKQRVNVIFNLLPRLQKNLIKGNGKFFEKALEIHKLGLSSIFGKKISLYKTKEDILNYMDVFIEENSEELNYVKINNKLKESDSVILYSDDDSGIIMAEILSYELSNEIGSSDWCISYNRTSWDTYTAGTNRQFFLWDFSLNRTDSLFLIGFTTNALGQITSIHDKFDSSLRGNIPIKIKNILDKVEVSTDPFEYKEKLYTMGENNTIKMIEHNQGDNVFIFEPTRDNLSLIKSDGWGAYFNPFNRRYISPSRMYVIYNFNYIMTDSNFALFIKFENDELSIKNNINEDIKFDINNIDIPIIQELYKDGYLKTKLHSEYLNEVNDALQELFDKSINEYESTSNANVNKFAEALFNFLVEEGELRIFEEESDENGVFIDKHLYEKYLLPVYFPEENVDDYLYVYRIISEENLMSDVSVEWEIGTEDMADKSAVTSLQNLIDDAGLTGIFPESFIQQFIDIESFSEYMLDGEDDYIREMILDDPGDYDIEPMMSEEDQEELDNLTSKVESITDDIDNIQELIDNYYKNGDDDIDAIEELEEKIALAKEELEEMEELIEEMEDVSNEDYWEISEDDIEEKVEEVMAQRRDEIEYDPIGYLKNMGYDEILPVIQDHIDIDDLIESVISTDGRANTLSTYDGIEHEYQYDNEYYCIYLRNE